MPWFKVDDGFHCHPKVLRAGNEAVGLYVRCGAYAAQQLTDGFIPEHIALLYGSDSLADTLVKVGLWRRARGGWRMPDYLDYNPSKKQVLSEREKTRERVRKHRESAGGKQKSNTVTNGVSNGVGTAAPSRPVPSSPEGTRTDTGSQSSSRRTARGNDDDSIDLQIVELLADRTGSEISALWATQVRQNILTGRNVRPGARMAYVIKAISERPHDFLPPVDSHVGERPPIQAAPEWCGYCDAHDRRVELADGTVARCEMCHPLVRRTA
ncbi:hypothetical protein [Streptosporangium sp. CA-115845]|uniref:hypothetical protein n=1 Tax=Streptosporangium sp. CA-115845 TaxID=3240071 RepID=UPI003D8DB654